MAAPGVADFGETPFARYCGTEEHNGLLTAVYELSSGTHRFTIEQERVQVR